MITCDRCQKKIEVTELHMEYEILFDGLVACRSCKDVFRCGMDQIQDELQAIKRERYKNWQKEWLQNYKAQE